MPAGDYVEANGEFIGMVRTDAGERAASGAYSYTLKAVGYVFTRNDDCLEVTSLYLNY